MHILRSNRIVKEYDMDKMIKYANMQEVKSVDSDNRVIEFIASKEIPDYDNDVVKLDGMDITKIKKNKSFLWSHKQTERPIGKILKVWRDGNTLKGKAQLTSEEEYDFGYSIYKLIKGGYINNISISFLPDYKSIEYKENKKTGERTQIINKSTLLECSAVNIGCNTGTSIQVKSFKEGINKAWDDDIIDGKELSQLDEAIDSLEKEVEEVVTEEMDYEAEIKLLKDEMEKLKDKSYMYGLFDKYKKEIDEKEDALDEVYDEIMYEKVAEDEYYQKLIEELKL